MKNNLIIIVLLLISCQKQQPNPNTSDVLDYRDAFLGYYSFTTEYITQSFYEDTIVSQSIGLVQKCPDPKRILIVVDTSASALKGDSDSLWPNNSFELYLNYNGDLIKDSTTFPSKNEIVGNIGIGSINFKGQYNTWGTGTSINYHHGKKLK